LHEDLLDVPVEVGVLEFAGVEARRVLVAVAEPILGRVEEIDEGQPGEGLLHEFAVGRVEEERVEAGQRHGLADGVPLPDLVAVQLITAVKGAQVTLNRQLAVHGWVLGAQIRLVEVVRVPHAGRAEAAVEHEWRVRTHQDGDRARAASRPGAARLVHGVVGRDDQGEPAVPGAALHPGDGVEEGGGAAVAGVGGVGALDVGAAVRLE